MPRTTEPSKPDTLGHPMVADDTSAEVPPVPVFWRGRVVTKPYTVMMMDWLRRRLHQRPIGSLRPVKMGVTLCRRRLAKAGVQLVIDRDAYYPTVETAPRPPTQLDRDRRDAIQSRKRVVGQCEWHGCTADAGFLTGHHIVPTSNGGAAADPNNIIVLCKGHHALVHGLYGLGFRPGSREAILRISRTLQPAISAAIGERCGDPYEVGFHST